jgi:putative membrane protein
MALLLRWLINAGTLLGIAYYLPGVGVSGFYAALITALVLGLVNALIRPLLIVLTLPINILTLGLFTLVINALMFWFVATVVKGFDVAGFWPAFWGALILSIVSWIVGLFLKK